VILDQFGRPIYDSREPLVHELRDLMRRVLLPGLIKQATEPSPLADMLRRSQVRESLTSEVAPWRKPL
jgi:hypothetical protein